MVRALTVTSAAYQGVQVHEILMEVAVVASIVAVAVWNVYGPAPLHVRADWP